MRELINTTKLVKRILEEDEKARNSDRYLILEVDKRLYPGIQDMPYGYVIEHRSGFGLPPFETIRRTRQKLQHDFPELAADKTVAEIRARIEAEYFDYAVSEVKV